MNGTDTYREWAPPVAWRASVRCLWEHRVRSASAHRVVPDGCADILEFGDGRRVVVGLFDRADLPDLPVGTEIRGIRLRPSAVRTVLGIPAAELRNLAVPLEGPVDLTVAPPPRVQAALAALACGTIDDAAAAVELSARQLRRMLHEHAGLGPKTFQRVLRLQHFLADDRALATAAVAAGYADQPHLTREVTELCGLPPAALRAERAARPR